MKITLDISWFLGYNLGIDAETCKGVNFMNQNQQRPTAGGLQTGSPSFVMTLIATALFVCIMVPILLSCAANPSPKLTPYTGVPVVDPNGGSVSSDPDFVPVFAPSSVVVKPYSTANTATAVIDSQYGVLIDAETGEIIAQKSSNVQFSPASMTKVMTLIVACENLSQEDLEKKIPFSEEIHEYVTSGSYKGMELGLPVETGSGLSCLGDRYYVKDMLYGIGIKSAAACSYMVVKQICDSEADFVALMNQKAKDMGLKNTVFDNVVGFDSPGNQTTAEDMATIMAYAMQSDLIADILAPRTKDYGIKAHYTDDYGVEQTYNVWFESSFISRQEKYPQFNLTTARLDATKTGYTDESFIVCMATSKQTGKQYILVLGNKETSHATISEKFKATMMDIESVYNQYVK